MLASRKFLLREENPFDIYLRVSALVFVYIYITLGLQTTTRFIKN